MIEIKMKHGYTAIVDAEDYPLLSRSIWHAKSHEGGTLVYAATNIDPYGRKLYARMHRIILAAPPGAFVDHINGNGLDNRKENLRICTPAENTRNRRKHVGRSKFKGVHPRPNGRWQAVICANARLRWLGTFDREEDAARAYDRAALDVYGDFSRLNFSSIAPAEGMTA